MLPFRVFSCGFVDRLIGDDNDDPRIHTKTHERSLPAPLASRTPVDVREYLSKFVLKSQHYMASIHTSASNVGLPAKNLERS